MAIIIFNLFNWFTFVPWRFIMRPLFRYWQKIYAGNLKRGVRVENIRIKAISPSNGLPFLTLLSSVNNGSETNIILKRIYGSIYIGDWRIATFDVHDPIQKNLGNNRQQFFTVRGKTIEKGGKSEIEFNFSPSIEFWLSSKDRCSLGDGAIEVRGYGVNITIPYIQDDIPIDGLEQGKSHYVALLKNKFSLITRGEK